jgi:NAD(P)-dependent dehydrogenase (short-subunit alcohol dehydrogenase family)
MRSSGRTPWQDKVVLVTGGSGGLGRAIAARFAAGGARVAIAARGQEKLDVAARELSAAGGQVLAIAADVTRQSDVDALLARTLQHWGRLDVLVNNAGRSARGDVLSTTPEDFQAALDLNFLAAVRCTLAAAPHLLSGGGHVVNIGSLAAKTATRYMGPYSASKFALAAYSQQLRLELGDRGLHVLLVCPGPIARNESREYSAAELTALPESARRPGAGVKVRQLDPDVLAGRILRACERRDRELIVPGKARLLFALSQLSPRLGDWLLRRFT